MNNLKTQNIEIAQIGWIGEICKLSDKGLLTAFPHFLYSQHLLIL